VERSLTRPAGLQGRTWFRNLIYVADANNGYANMVFPTINEAIRAGDRERAARELMDLAHRFDAATQAIVDARHGLIVAHPVRGVRR
jgi:N-acetylated-alpha-linked acidic dipeptidase